MKYLIGFLIGVASVLLSMAIYYKLNKKNKLEKIAINIVYELDNMKNIKNPNYPEFKEEYRNEMKLCTLCNIPEYSELDALSHHFKAFHMTWHPEWDTHSHWQPIKGHKDYEKHLQAVKLLGLILD